VRLPLPNERIVADGRHNGPNSREKVRDSQSPTLAYLKNGLP
jgi:hypothetical protein